MLEMLIGLVLFAFVLWLVTEFIPMNDKFKQLIIGVSMSIAVVWVLMTLFGYS